MGIKASCYCGAQFMAKPELAGKEVKCPTCGQTFRVPAPTPSQPSSNYFTEKAEELQKKMGTQQMSMLDASRELKDLIVDGDTARGTQVVSLMGRTVELPIEFRRIDGSWLIHHPSFEEMAGQRALSDSLFKQFQDTGGVITPPPPN